uniref:Uncharacterized protein n=1 Tax=Lactuca sativa TaxID=4236 RepID=A0A9R1WSV6_LACSA|nr:hypothetical protein LSAT_V11C100026660 [Lactuca sativa]
MEIDEFECKDRKEIENIYFVLGGCKGLPRVIFQRKLEIGNKRWARLCFLVVRYNIMTSNSAKCVNALSRDTRKLPITMLIDFY